MLCVNKLHVVQPVHCYVNKRDVVQLSQIKIYLKAIKMALIASHLNAESFWW